MSFHPVRDVILIIFVILSCICALIFPFIDTHLDEISNGVSPIQ